MVGRAVSSVPNGVSSKVGVTHRVQHSKWAKMPLPVVVRKDHGNCGRSIFTSMRVIEARLSRANGSEQEERK